MIFVRHPKPDIEPGICYGRLDMDIHPDGHAQIERALTAIGPASRIISSPAKRCRGLALALARRDRLAAEFDARLLEMDMGEWEGVPWREIPRELSEQWLRDPFNLPCPGGESFRQLQGRVLEALSDIDRKTVVICHAGPIRAVQMAWLGLSFEEAFAQAPAYAEPVPIHPETAWPVG